MLVLLYSPCPSKKSAQKLARHLLSKKLIACANIYPSASLYNWKGKLQSEKEFILIAKTTPAKAKKAKAELEKLHSYEIPCVLALPASSNEKYEKWAKAQVH